MPVPILPDADALVADIRDGAVLAVMKDSSGAPVALARALVRRRIRRLHLLCVPTGGLVADLLIGAGCVERVEGGGVSLGEYGPAPCFARTVREGTVRPVDTTCPAVYSALQAAEKGVPFMPMRGLIGSDILAYRDDYRVIDNPYANADPIVLIPAIRPDHALIHAPLADRHGNVWIGRHHELGMLAHAAMRTLVTVEALQEENLLADPLRATGTLPALYVTALAIEPRGAWPCAMPGCYSEDRAAFEAYAKAAANPLAWREWLDDFLAEPARAA